MDDGSGWNDILLELWSDAVCDAVVARIQRETVGRRGWLVRVFCDPESVRGEFTETAHALARTNPNFDANYIEDADYLKIREISARYDVSGLLHNAGVTTVESLSIGVAARNLYTFTSYSGPDPEVNFDGARSLSRGQEFLTLPTPRQLYFTVSVGL